MSTYHCAVCDTPIAKRHLMCAGHWRMVPSELQQRVYSAWFALQRHGGERCSIQPLRQTYQQARDDAVLVVARLVAGEEQAS